MLQNLKNEAALQNSLQKNPFNHQQVEGYSNLFGDIGNFRNNVAPGLMDFANRGMTSSYQRQTGGPVGSGGGYGGNVRPGGLMQSGQGAFSVNRGAGLGQNGLLDLNGAQNPYSNGLIQQPAPAPVAQAPSYGGLLANQNQARGGGYGGSTGSPSGGIGIGNYTDSINERALSLAQKYGMASPIAGLLAGLISNSISESDALGMINASPDSIGMLNALQAWTDVDPEHDLYGFGANGGATSDSSSNGSPGHNNAGSTAGSDRGEGGGPSSSSRSGL